MRDNVETFLSSEMEPSHILIIQTKKTSENCTKPSKKSTNLHLCRWLLFIFLITCIFLAYFSNICEEWQFHPPVMQIIFHNTTLENIKSGFLVDMPGCRIPDMDPFDPTVKKFINKPNNIKCEKHRPLVVGANLTSLYILNSSFEALKIKKEEEIECCYQPFWRTTVYEKNKMADNIVTFANYCIPFNNSVKVTEEFVKVICKVNGEEVHRNYHAFVPYKPEVEEHCEEALKNSSSKVQERLSVLAVGMDSVSRINLHRQMPKTVKLLENMGAIELLGYNKVADNTFLNLMPVLSGFTESELANTTCWSQNSTFDKCNWIWKNFSAVGFRTAFGEDASEMGLFTYLKRGFQKQPTDYYPRTIMKTSEDDIGYNKDPYAKVCLGSELTYIVLLRYIKNYAFTMASKDSFAFFWVTSLSHDYMNYPSLGDDKFVEFFNELVDSGSLDRTLLVFMSDHGIRWGGIRETYQGRLEERLPFVFFVFPRWFKEKYPTAVANLRKNKHRLTTPFDMYKTLYDIVDLEQLEQEAILKRSEELSRMTSKPRANSLFLLVNKSRNCEEAGIEKHWCTCQKSESLSIKNPTVLKMSLVLVKHVNKMLEPYGLCSKLQFVEVKSASVQFPLEDVAKKITDKGLKDYVIVVRTAPGDALFEATVRHHLANNTVTVIGAVSRINAYGSQSACITDYHMKLYCFCLSFLNSSTENSNS